MKHALFGPSPEEIDRMACDLIVRHGLDAYDEAVRLSEVTHLLPHTLMRSNLYRQVADQIELSFTIAREKLRAKMTVDAHVLDLVARLNAQEQSREATALSR
jgi:hypothetical protein